MNPAYIRVLTRSVRRDAVLPSARFLQRMKKTCPFGRVRRTPSLSLRTFYRRASCETTTEQRRTYPEVSIVS